MVCLTVREAGWLVRITTLPSPLPREELLAVIEQYCTDSKKVWQSQEHLIESRGNTDETDNDC